MKRYHPDKHYKAATSTLDEQVAKQKNAAINQICMATNKVYEVLIRH